MDLGIFRFKRIIARDIGVPYRSVKIYGVGHHGAFYTKRMDAPFWVKILVDGEDITSKYPNTKLRDMHVFQTHLLGDTGHRRASKPVLSGHGIEPNIENCPNPLAQEQVEEPVYSAPFVPESVDSTLSLTGHRGRGRG